MAGNTPRPNSGPNWSQMSSNLGNAVSGRGAPPVAPVSSTKAGFNVDSSGLTQLDQNLSKIISSIGTLDSKLQSLDKTLDSIQTKFSNIASMGGSNGPGAGPGGSRNTSAPVSFKGGAGSALGAAAAGEIASQWGGKINSWMSSAQSGGVGFQLAATQSGGITGTGMGASVSAFNKMPGLSTSDRTQAVNGILQNPFLSTMKPGTPGFRNMQNFIAQSQKLNPGMGASGAVGLASTLTSPQAQQAFSMFGGTASRGGGVFNVKSGQVNSPQEIYKTVLQYMTGRPNLTGAQAKQIAQNPYSWNSASQNAQMKLGLSAAQLVPIQQYAAAGMNLNAADKNIGGTQASSLLGKATATSQTQVNVTQATTGFANALNNATRDVQNWASDIVQTPLGGILTNLGVGGASLSKTFLSLAASGAEMYAMFKAISGLSGGGGILGKLLGRGSSGAGGAGEAGAASTVGAGAEDAAVAAGTGAAAVGAGTVAVGVGALLGLGISSYALTHMKLNKRTLGGKALPPRGSVSDDKGGFIYKGKDYKTAEDYYKTVHLGDPPTGSTTTAGMKPGLAKGVSAMMAANPSIKISSGHRSSAQQAYLYAAKGGQGVARPGQSAHQSGNAADLGPPSQFGWIARNAAKFGLARPAPSSEPWHVQTMGDPAASVTGAQVVSTAASQEGVNYVYGGETAGKAFDCSGLVQWVYSKLGISLPRTSQAQASAGTAVPSLAQAQPGDLILYNEPGEGPNSHVAIYIGGGKQIAAPHTGTTVQVQAVDTGHLSCIRRIIGGGGGSQAASAAQGAVGSASNDSSNHGGVSAGTAAGSLANGFIGQVGANNAWTGGAGAIYASASTGGTGSTSTSTGGSGSTTTTSSSPAVSATGDLTASQVYKLAMGAGLSAGAARTATAVAKVESSFNTSAVDHDSNGTTDYGLWQINSVNGGSNALFDPTKAAAKMAAMTNKGTSWGDWGPDFGESGYGVNPPAGGMPGSKVAGAMAGLGTMGDPVGGMGSMGGGSGVSMGGGGRRTPISIPIGPFYVTGTQSDAQSIAQMVKAAIASLQEVDAVSGS